MKKTIAILLVLFLCIGLCACVGQDAEEAEVKSYLINYKWYRFVGGNYDMEDVYIFHSDGTYESYILHSSPVLDSHNTGTYNINTNKQTIRFKCDNGSKYEWTYSLYAGSMKLFNSSFQEFVMIDK